MYKLLYNKNVENIFSSKAKLNVLGAILKTNQPLFLRELSVLARTQIRSVQLVVQQLMREKLIVSKRKKNRLYFELNSSHPDAEFCRKIFSDIEKYKIQKKAKSYSLLAPRILEFNQDMFELVKGVKHEPH